MKMKTVMQNIKIGIFMGALILPSLIWYGAKLLAPDLYREWDYDLGENRTREPFPEEFDIENYTRLLETYYDDHLPFRSGLISAEQKLSGKLEKWYDSYLQSRLTRLVYREKPDTVMDISDLVLIYETEMEDLRKAENGHGGKDAPHDGMTLVTQEADYDRYGCKVYQCRICGEIYYGDFVGKWIDNSYLPPRRVGENVVPGRNNWLFYAGDDSISYYRGTNILAEDQMAAYLKRMIRLQELCEEKGIRLQFMIMPNKEQVYSEYMPSYEIEDTYKRTERFVDYVKENSDVNIIYPIRELKTAGIFWKTYYSYDTHWNMLGGYVGTQALYKALGMPVTSVYEVEIEEYRANTEELFSLGGLDASEYPDDTEYLVHYKPEVTATAVEGYFTADIYRTCSDFETRQNFVLLGDSFRHAMAEYLVKDFSDTVIVHRDYIEEVKESIRSADILVIAAVERKDAELFSVVEKVIRILEEEP